MYPNSKDHRWQKNHSDVSQIAGVALLNGQKDLLVCDTGFGSLKIVKCREDSTPSLVKNVNFKP